jgi:hypothetical protein
MVAGVMTVPVVRLGQIPNVVEANKAKTTANTMSQLLILAVAIFLY